MKPLTSLYHLALSGVLSGVLALACSQQSTTGGSCEASKANCLAVAGGSGGTWGSGGMSDGTGGAVLGSGGATPQAAGGEATGGTGVSVASGGDGSDISTSGGASGGSEASDPPFILGADISSVQESTASFVDTDGKQKSIFELLKNHGFNYIRLRNFVDPNAPYGYASTTNGCAGKSESYGDKAHVIAYGKAAKQNGMGFLLDLHYSDTWADPGNQIIPEAWRSSKSITELANFMKSYTKDIIQSAIDQGARPDMVQVGNEITPGLLLHVPGPDTDCWGNSPVSSSIGGSTSNWDQLATLLKAGVAGVREVDPSIKIMLHIENTDQLAGVRSWVNGAVSRGVDFDILGLSCYTAFQGQPSVWQNTFATMAQEFPQLKFVIAEYNPARSEANTLIKNLPDGRGLGTFFWEPTQSGEWGDALLNWQGNSQIADKTAFDEFDQLLPSLGL